jgi:thymidylate synthase ThyX
MDVFVLDGSDVPNPEDMAMIQALYSRSPQSVVIHLEKVKEKGSSAFHEKYYVGYGHKSIGDTGTVTICIEDVSMLCAKAIQDTPLYNGQEASTRYLDFSTRPMVNPAATPEGAGIQSECIGLYNRVLERIVPYFQQRFPRQEGQKEGVWKTAIAAKAFDVARGFLPAGCTTFVAWHTNLRQAHDHLSLLRHHPCLEVRMMAERVHAALLKRYPSSFGHKRYDATEEYLAKSAARFAFTDGLNVSAPVNFLYSSRLDMDGLALHRDLLESRPTKTELHQRFRQYGDVRFCFPLDFGSYRDLQRHRSCVQEMPLVTTKHGFLPWYLEQLPEGMAPIMTILLDEVAARIAKLQISDAEKQYYVPMGYQNPTKITCSLPSAVYIAELRSGTTVHPTVRKVAQQMGQALKLLVPYLALHHDMSESEWDIKRGTQDITPK